MLESCSVLSIEICPSRFKLDSQKVTDIANCFFFTVQWRLDADYYLTEKKIWGYKGGFKTRIIRWQVTHWLIPKFAKKFKLLKKVLTLSACSIKITLPYYVCYIVM